VAAAATVEPPLPPEEPDNVTGDLFASASAPRESPHGHA